MQYLVKRLPVLQEDEGNPHLIALVDTFEQAEQLVANSMGNYFNRDDFEILTVHNRGKL